MQLPTLGFGQEARRKEAFSLISQASYILPVVSPRPLARAKLIETAALGVGDCSSRCVRAIIEFIFHAVIVTVAEFVGQFDQPDVVRPTVAHRSSHEKAAVGGRHDTYTKINLLPWRKGLGPKRVARTIYTPKGSTQECDGLKEQVVGVADARDEKTSVGTREYKFWDLVYVRPPK